jgi:hypothetical protein
MKKLAIGCAIFIMVCVVGGAIGSYYVYHKVRSTISGFAELGKVPEIERSVRNQSPYAPPSNGEISAAQLQKFLAVQQKVRAKMGVRAAEMERTYHTLLSKKEATALDMPELVAAYRDLAGVYVDGKRAQVDALNAAGFSLDEYRWVRTQSYAALGVPMMDFDVTRMIEDAKAGRTPAAPNRMITVGPTGPPANQKLVKPYEKVITDYAPFGFFGL